MTGEFRNDVIQGLSAEAKYLASSYFYDDIGDKLFQEIMAMDEYYLTRTEKGILETHAAEIIAAFCRGGEPAELIELGAGDGVKTSVLIEEALASKFDFTYSPIDISQHILDVLVSNMSSQFPNLNMNARQGDYFKQLKAAGVHVRKIVLFLGSTIGNMKDERIHSFLAGIASSLNPGDVFFLGTDLKKDPRVILDAYNDKEGITAKFNFNILERIKRELGAEINLSNWMHYPYYNPQTGEARSYLISKVRQSITLDSGESFAFEPYEAIHTEVSRKFGIKELEVLATTYGFEVEQVYTDEQDWFANSIWIKK